MAWEGYFCLGGTEIVNNTRAIMYARTATCPVDWIDDEPCDGIYDMLDGPNPDPPYNAANIPEEAPWYDTGQFENVPSRDFLGVYCIDAVGLVDSTRTAESQERILDGGVIGNQRNALRSVRFRCLLTGLTAEALDFGLDWLSSRLQEQNCETHASGCGTSDLTYFVDCQEPHDGTLSWTEYNALVDSRTRRLHGVKCVSGPLVQEKIQRSGAWGYIVEFTIDAQTPQPFSLPRTVQIDGFGESVVQDIPINLVEYPSAELGAGSVIIAHNYSTNPSVETDATGWSRASAIVTGTSSAPYLTSGRSTDLAADGTASFRVRLLGDGATVVTNARSKIYGYQDVDLTMLPADSRVSFTIWSGVFILGGASGSVLNGARAYVEWYNVSTLLDTVVIATAVPAGFAGRVYSAESFDKPDAATKARVLVEYDVTWSSSATPANNSDIRAYLDALAVTVP